MTKDGKTPQVSVVMPIYNPGDYLFESMDSVLGQTFTDIEVVCVNDGSTDDSLSVMRDYARSDRRVRIIDKPNGGYGHAMNRGMDAATGTYVMILEPDDFMSLDMVERLHATAEEHRCDVVKSNYFAHEGVTGADTLVDIADDKPVNTVLNAMDTPSVVITQPCIWSAIYRRDLLTRHGIRFSETPGASYQDTGFAFKALSAADRVMFVPEAYLHYRIDNEASSVKSSGKIFNVCDELAAMESFVCTYAERRARLMPALQRIKFATYDWNLQRISDEFADQFRDRMALELIKARYDGFLDRSYFNDNMWKRLTSIIEGYEKHRPYAG